MKLGEPKIIEKSCEALSALSENNTLSKIFYSIQDSKEDSNRSIILKMLWSILCTDHEGIQLNTLKVLGVIFNRYDSDCKYFL